MACGTSGDNRGWGRLFGVVHRKWRMGLLLGSCCVVVFSVLSLCRSDSPHPVFDRVVPPGLFEIAPGFHYISWYRDESGFEPTADHFGAFVLQPMGDRLILGFGGQMLLRE